MNELTKKILFGIAGTGAALGLGYWLFGRKQGEDLGGYGEVEDIEPMRIQEPDTEGGYTAKSKGLPRARKAGACKPVPIIQDLKSNTQILACKGQRLGRVQHSKDIYEFAQGQTNILQEEFVVLSLDTRNNVLASSVVHRGNATGVNVSLADAFRVPIIHGASRAALIHNHPSGDPTPSPADIALTRKAVEAGDLLGIKVLDHVIVGKDGYMSLRDFDYTIFT